MTLRSVPRWSAAALRGALAGSAVSLAMLASGSALAQLKMDPVTPDALLRSIGAIG